MTWVIATIIIVVMLLIFVYSSSLLAGLNKVNVGAKRLFASNDYSRTNQSVNTKTAMAYVMSDRPSAVKNWAQSNKINLDDYLK
jgi:hypothetical protein